MSPLSSSWSSGRGSAIPRKRIVKEGSFGKPKNKTWVRGERDQTRVFAWWVLERIERRYSPTQKPKTRKPRKAWYISIEREKEREKSAGLLIFGGRERKSDKTERQTKTERESETVSNSKWRTKVLKERTKHVCVYVCSSYGSFSFCQEHNIQLHIYIYIYIWDRFKLHLM